MEINANRMPQPVMNAKNTEKPKNTDNDPTTEQKDQYIPSSGDNKKVTYDKPKIDHATIGRLKEESDRAYSQLRRMVEELLRAQGKTFQDIKLDTEVEVDEATSRKAQELIGVGGEHSPEKVSDRILEFAKAISGGDKSKFELLKSAIEEGFKQAADMLGGSLPEISQQTYDLVMQKLDQWKEEA